jgi:hypothetical protein
MHSRSALAAGATALAAGVQGIALSSRAAPESISATPQYEYASSVGVLGCKIEYNRFVAFPFEPTCDGICVRLTEPVSRRSLAMLHVDFSSSGKGTYDVAADAWNYLASGNFLHTGGPSAYDGGVPMTWEPMAMSEPACLELLSGGETAGRLALVAQNPNFAMGCLDSAPDSWVARNYVLLNIQTEQCTLGVDEVCKLTPDDHRAGLTQASCPSGLGLQRPLEMAVMQYGQGSLVPTPAP